MKYPDYLTDEDIMRVTSATDAADEPRRDHREEPVNDCDEWLDPADGEPYERVTSAWWWLFLVPAGVCLIANATRGWWS